MKNLQILSTPFNNDIIDKEKLYKTTNKPYTRQAIIINTLKKTFENCDLNINNYDLIDLENKLNQLNSIDRNYLIFLKNVYSSYLNSEQSSDLISPYDNGLVNYIFPKIPNINKLPYHLQISFYTNDFCTSIFEHTYEASVMSAANGLFLNLPLLDQTVYYCCNVFPGHHSTNATYNGYCFLNNCAIITNHLLSYYKKICILDIDYHHGDGTQEIYENNHNVLTVSIHGDPINNYPFHTGYVDENTETNINFPLPSKTTRKDYLLTLKTALIQIKNFSPDVIVIAFGSDTFIDDPQGSFNLNISDYEIIGQNIESEIDKPIIVSQEGGYDLNVVDKIIANFLKGLIN